MWSRTSCRQSDGIRAVVTPERPQATRLLLRPGVKILLVEIAS